MFCVRAICFGAGLAAPGVSPAATPDVSPAATIAATPPVVPSAPAAPAAPALPAAAPSPAPIPAPPVEAPPPLRLEVGPERIVCGVTSTVPSRAAGTGHRSGGKPGLVLWFHGGMRGGRRDKGLEAHRQLLTLVDPASRVLASPSAFAGRDWLAPGTLATVEALLDTLFVLYPIDPEDIRLIGVSDGSLAVIRYGLEGRRKVRTKILVSSLPQLALDPATLPGRKRLAEGRWHFLQGGRDRLFPADAVVPVLREWERHHPNARLHYFPEGEHDFSYYAAHAGPLLKELLGPQKPKKVQVEVKVPKKDMAIPVK